MAKKQRKSNNEQELMEVDGYFLPKDMMEMYLALRQAVIEEVQDWMEANYSKVEFMQKPAEDSCLIAYNETNQEVMRFVLSPHNISLAQQARDKAKLHEFLEKKRV